MRVSRLSSLSVVVTSIALAAGTIGCGTDDRGTGLFDTSAGGSGGGGGAGGGTAKGGAAAAAGTGGAGAAAGRGGSAGKGGSMGGTGGASGSAGMAGGGMGGAAGGGVCGDGHVDKGEDCDDGNKIPGDGCENDCTFTCNANSACDDKNPCNGTETCMLAKHVCQAGTPLGEGADCGGGKICLSGTCTAPSCGDGKVESGEECDDGNAKNGDGCDTDCKFSCKTGDPTRDCTSNDPCVGNGTCDDAGTHTCSPGMNAPLGTACGSGMICNMGTCKASICGDGYVDMANGEVCDDGNTTAGDGCDPNCKLSCTVPATDCPMPSSICAVAICTAMHTCGTMPDPTTDGMTCGNGLVCMNGMCAAPTAVCGNGVVDPGEVCDDGNTTPGDGCEANCQSFTCTTAATDCTPVVCQIASCADVKQNGTKVGQTCAYAPDPSVQGMSPPGCMAPSTCQNGVCSAPNAVCGNGKVETGEQCDFGAGNGPGTGCETNCTFSCTKSPDSCPDANPCNGTEACGTVTVNMATGQACSPGTPLADGTSCGMGSICLAQQCKPSTCGDGFTDANAGEQCDFGAANGPGTGCESNCQFSCATTQDCTDNNPCNGTETCGPVTVNGNTGQKCSPGMPLMNGAPCGNGMICLGSPIACVASTCGDGFVDMSRGEQCEPPNTMTCDAQCHTISGPVCGNGKVEGTFPTGEECDDMNSNRLDGCDPGCKYQVANRMTTIAISKVKAFAGCMPATNFLGTSVLTGAAVDQLNSALSTDVTGGSTNVLIQALGLDDLTGVADSALQVGVMSGAPDPAKGAWPAAGNPEDWWFLVDATTVDATGAPTTLLPATLAARKLTTTPTDVTLNLLLGGSPAKLAMRAATVVAQLDGNPAPNAPPTPPPAAIESGLVTFQTVTASTNGTQGLCGNITVDSLAQIPIPQLLTTGVTACVAPNAFCKGTQKYTYCGANMPVGPNCNSLLDVIVGGCKVTAFCVGAVNASPKPDVAGTGATTLTLGPGNKVPASQTTGNTNAYSAYLTFTANRAHLTGKQ